MSGLGCLVLASLCAAVTATRGAGLETGPRAGPPGMLSVAAAAEPAPATDSRCVSRSEEETYAPLDPVNQAPYPTATTGEDAHPEEINVVNGHDEAENLDWGHGQGYVHAPISAVWAALQDKDVVADRRQLTSGTLLDTEPPPGATFGFTLQCVTNSSPSVTYVQQWRSRATRGTAAEPRTVVVRDDLAQQPKVLGITVITTLSDSIVLEPVDDDTTSISIIRHVAAAQSDPKRAGKYVSDLFNSVVANVHGSPLPTY